MRALESQPSEAALERLEIYEERRLEAASGGPELTKAELAGYRHSDVKLAVIAETRGKCAYCESSVTHVYWGDVEHILPKSEDCHPELRFDYQNLTFACAKCNGAKSNYCDDAWPLVNPYEDNPDDFLIPLGSMSWQHEGSARGELTIHHVALNRKGLVERRQERIEALGRLAQRWLDEGEGPRKDAIFEQIETEIGGEREFTMHVVAAARAMGVPV